MCSDTLLISPKYNANHWAALDKMKPEDWPTAAAIVRDRLHGRFIQYADTCLTDPSSGFVVLAIDCLLVETIQQFIDGIIDGTRQAKTLCKRFLEGPRFSPHFDTDQKRLDFYLDIRCGLLHSAEAKNQWRVRRDQPEMLKMVGTGYILNVRLFHAAIKASFDDYLAEIVDSAKKDLREKLWIKMNHICDVRSERGVMETLTAGTTQITP